MEPETEGRAHRGAGLSLGSEVWSGKSLTVPPGQFGLGVERVDL